MNFLEKYEIVATDIRESLKEALQICKGSLRDVKKQRIWYLIASFLLVIPLIYSMGLDNSVNTLGAIIGFNILRLFVTAILCYAVFMSTIWNCVEKNALKAGCLAMEIHLLQLNNNIRNNIDSNSTALGT